MVFASATARATPSARLVYSRSLGAESCADEQALRTAVAARVGYDPFFPWAKQTVVVAMAPGPSRGFAASVSLVDEQGFDHGIRTFRTDDACRELTDVAALAIAIAIDPHSLLPRPAAAKPESDEPPPSPPPPGPHPLAVAPAAPRPQLAPRPRTPLVFEGTAGVAASAGTALSPALGGSLGVGLRRGRLSLEVDGRIDAPASVPARGGGQITSELIAATLAPCLHLGPSFVCAVGQIGSVKDEAEAVAAARSYRTTWLAAGGRFGVEVPLGSGVGVLMQSDVLRDLDPRTLTVNGFSRSVPAVATSLGLAAAVHFQ
jgi:hypothetical protein